MAEEASTQEVNFGEYEEIKAGEKQETTVTKVEKGKQEDFRSESYWSRVDDTPANIEVMKGQPAVQVTTENNASLVLNLPVSKKISPKSNLALWKKTYGSYPHVGQNVTTRVDENGFFRVVIEK